MGDYKINTKNEYIKYKSGIWHLASEILKQYNIENTGTNQYKLYVWIKKENKEFWKFLAKKIYNNSC